MPHDAIHVFGAWAEAGRAEPMGRSHAPRASQALEQLPVRPGDRAIDLGCGEGWASRRLAVRTGPEGEVVGLDGSGAMLVRARATPTSARYLLGDLLALPFDDGRFDHAFSMEALYYVDIDAALAEVARVLRPGGHLAVCADFYAEHEASHSWPEELGLTMDLRSQVGWERAVAAAGFRDVRSERLADPAKPSHPGTLAVFGVR